MGKYEALEEDIFSVFDAVAWKAENIKTFPSNFTAKAPGNEFIRISVIPRGRGLNLSSTSGISIIDIFIAAGVGPKRAHFIADRLDAYLVGKSIALTTGRSTQFLGSSLAPLGPDRDNPTLTRYQYTIPFTHTGVL